MGHLGVSYCYIPPGEQVTTSQPNLPVILQGSGAWLAAIGNGAWPDMMAGDKSRVTVQGQVQVVLYIKTLLYWQNTIMNFTFI